MDLTETAEDDEDKADDLCFEEVEVMPSQSSTPMCDRVKLLGWEAEKNILYRPAISRGRRGYERTYARTRKQRHIRRAQREKLLHRADTMRDAFLTETRSWYASRWLDEMAEFEGDLEFPDTTAGDMARYYQRLLATVQPEVWAEWADYDLPSWELDDLSDRLDLTAAEEADARNGFWTTSPEDSYWWMYDEYWDEQICEQQRRLEQAHFRSVLYGHPYDDFGMSVYPDWDHEAEERRLEDAAYHNMMIDWEDIDAMVAEEEAEEERLLESLSISQSGGARGWRAGKFAARRDMRLVA